MKYFQTDEDGYFVGEFEADKSPLEPGKFLIPRGGVLTKPPATGANQAARYVAGAWSLVPDFRGVAYWTADHKKTVITERGVSVPVGTFPADPPLTQTEIDTAASNAAKVKLAEIDLKSIRSIREYIAAKADAPAILKTLETDAQAERVKVK